MQSIYPLWRRRLIHLFAKALGVLVHIEGFPFGSNRIYLRSRAGSVNTGRGGVSGEDRNAAYLKAAAERRAADAPTRKANPLPAEHSTNA